MYEVAVQRRQAKYFNTQEQKLSSIRIYTCTYYNPRKEATGPSYLPKSFKNIQNIGNRIPL